MTNETNGKKRTRRNFEKILAELKQYCEIKRDVLKSIDGSGQDPLWKSSIDAYEDVLKRIEAR